MTLLDAPFLDACRSLQQAAVRIWGRRLLGRPVERQLAGGTEVTGHADYTSGHDFRYVDWGICARHDELLSKQFQGTDDQHVYLLLDASRSMQLGQPSKFDAARRLTAALAYMALAGWDRVQIVVVSDRLLHRSESVRGLRYLPTLLAAVEQAEADGRATDLRAAVEQFVRSRRRTGLVVLLSDLLDPAGFEPALGVLRRWGDQPYLLQVLAHDDADPGPLGRVRLHDVESDRRVRSTLESADLDNYRRSFERFQRGVVGYCARYHVGLTQTFSDVPFQRCLERMIRATEGQLASGLTT